MKGPRLSWLQSALRQPDAQHTGGGRMRMGVWAVSLAFWWAVFGLMFAARDRFWAAALGNETIAWIDAVRQGLLQSCMGMVLILVAFWIAKRFPLELRSWRRNVLLHVAIGAVVIPANVLLLHGAYRLASPEQPATATLVRTFVSVFPGWSLMYATMLGMGYGIQYFYRYRDRRLRASQLETQLARARLQALNMQLHPHFLFNTLNSISALMHRDVRAADRTLSRLEDLLRLTLSKSAAQEVPLRDEIEILEPYLEIEQTRFGDRLTVEWAVEPQLLDAVVPQLVLQPLVENAIKHGIAPRSSPGRIRISAQEVAGMLELEVSDNGPGLAGESRPNPRFGGAASRPAPQDRGGCGVGLANTRARLKQLYPREHQLVLGDRPGGGARVHLRIPLRFLRTTEAAA
jgi:two-component system, LytTR family, sensor kinase